MSGFYNGKAERERQERDTPERILQIARSRGSFSVSLRYRDDWLRKRCRKLKAQGLLVGGRRDGREVVFYPAKTPPVGDGGGHGTPSGSDASQAVRDEPIRQASEKAREQGQ